MMAPSTQVDYDSQKFLTCFRKKVTLDQLPDLAEETGIPYDTLDFLRTSAGFLTSEKIQKILDALNTNYDRFCKVEKPSHIVYATPPKPKAAPEILPAKPEKPCETIDYQRFARSVKIIMKVDDISFDELAERSRINKVTLINIVNDNLKPMDSNSRAKHLTRSRTLTAISTALGQVSYDALCERGNRLIHDYAFDGQRFTDAAKTVLEKNAHDFAWLAEKLGTNKEYLYSVMRDGRNPEKKVPDMCFRMCKALGGDSFIHLEELAGLPPRDEQTQQDAEARILIGSVNGHSLTHPPSNQNIELPVDHLGKVASAGRNDLDINPTRPS